MSKFAIVIPMKTYRGINAKIRSGKAVVLNDEEIIDYVDKEELEEAAREVDVYLGATQLRHDDPANMYCPGEFRFGGGHVFEKLVAGEKIQLIGLSYGTDGHPRREIRT